MLETWLLIVFGVTSSRRAIAAVGVAAASRSRISISRAVRSGKGSGSARPVERSAATARVRRCPDRRSLRSHGLPGLALLRSGAAAVWPDPGVGSVGGRGVSAAALRRHRDPRQPAGGLRRLEPHGPGTGLRRPRGLEGPVSDQPTGTSARPVSGARWFAWASTSLATPPAGWEQAVGAYAEDGYRSLIHVPEC